MTPADIRDIVDAAQAGDEGYRRLLVPFAGFAATNAPELAKSALQRWGEGARFDVKRAPLAEIARRFHDNAGTITPVIPTLKMIADGRPLIRMSFTPDLFPNLSMYGEALFADRLARELQAHGQQAAQVIIAVDSEVAGDKRSRSSTFPDVKRDGGLLRLACAVPQTAFPKLSTAVPPPTRQEAEGWLRHLRASIRDDQRALDRAGLVCNRTRMRETLEIIEHEILEAQSRAHSLADFNLVFASRLLNLHWNVPVAFVSLREASPFLIDAYASLLSRFDEIVAQSQLTWRQLNDRSIAVAKNATFTFDQLPFWLICPQCSTRVTMQRTTPSAVTTVGRCTLCARDYAVHLPHGKPPELAAFRDHLVPRLLLDDLTNTAIWNVIAGVSNAGSVRHLIAAYETASKLGLAVAAEGLLRLRGVYFGPAELRLARLLEDSPQRAMKLSDMMRRVFWGKASILYYLISQGVDGLRDLWKGAFDSDQSVADPNIAESPFTLSAAAKHVLVETMSRLPPR